MRKDVITSIVLVLAVLGVGMLYVLGIGVDVLLQPVEGLDEKINLLEDENLYLGNFNAGDVLSADISTLYDGFIVILKDPSVAEKYSKLVGETGMDNFEVNIQNVESFEAEIDQQQKRVQDILSEENIVVEKSFKTVLNALVVDKLPSPELIKNSEEIESVYPNYFIQVNLDESTQIIGANMVWDLNSELGPCSSQGECLEGDGIEIGIIDTGVDYTHPDLGGCFGPGCKVIGGYDFVNNDPDPMDDNGHGTHVAATAAGNGDFIGVAPGANIIAYKVIDLDGGGSLSLMIEAIERAADPNQDGDFSDHLDVISLSLGIQFGGSVNDPGATAIDNVEKLGVLSVIASGNFGPNLGTLTSPGVARKAITVGASCKPTDVGIDPLCDSNIAKFSSRGPNEVGQIKPDVVAPGVSICAARWNGAFESSLGYPDKPDVHLCGDESHIAISGSSMATPIVSGVAALLRQAHPDWSPGQIKALVKENSIPYTGSIGVLDQGRGLVNVFDAVQDRDKPPIIRAEMSSSFYDGNPIILSYEIEHMNAGIIKVEKSVMSDRYDTENIWQMISSENFLSGIHTNSLFLDEFDPNSFAQLYRISFEDTLTSRLYYEDLIIFTPDLLEGWPVEISAPENCLLENTFSGNLRDDTSGTEDVLAKVSSRYCTAITGIYDYNASNHVAIPRDREDQVKGVFFDLDGDGFNELVYGRYTYDKNLVRTLHSSNAPRTAPILEDINNDGQVELLYHSVTQSRLFIINPLTQEIYGSLPFKAHYRNFLSGNSGIIAVGDLDNDGNVEVVSNLLEVVSFTGEGFETKEFEIDDSTVPLLSALAGSIVIADLDNNGWREIIWSQGTNITILEKGVITYDLQISDCLTTGFNEVVVGDLIGDDNNLEILFGTCDGIQLFDSKLNIINKVPYEADVNNYLGYAPFIIDVDNDGVSEIVSVLDKIYIYNNNLELIDGSKNIFLEPGSFNQPNSPYFTDLDNDGELDLLVNTFGSFLNQGVAKIFAFKTGFITPENPDRFWLQKGYIGNNRCYRCNLQCADGIDNDNNGFTDFPDDIGCSSVYDDIESFCADTNANGWVEVSDLLALLAGWGPNPGHVADFDSDGDVDVTDLLTLLASWGSCTEKSAPLDKATGENYIKSVTEEGSVERGDALATWKDILNPPPSTTDDSDITPDDSSDDGGGSSGGGSSRRTVPSDSGDLDDVESSVSGDSEQPGSFGDSASVFGETPEEKTGSLAWFAITLVLIVGLVVVIIFGRKYFLRRQGI